MANHRRLIEHRMMKALACGMLEDRGRMLFLLQKDAQGIERIGLPCTDVYSGESPVHKLAAEFKRQTGIDAEICEIRMESKHNSGSRKRKNWVPCLVFSVKAKVAKAVPSGEFSGFKWLSLDDAKKMKLGRKAEWIRRL